MSECYSCNLTDDEARIIIRALINGINKPMDDGLEPFVDDGDIELALEWGRTNKSKNTHQFKMVMSEEIALVVIKVDAGKHSLGYSRRKLVNGVN